jgi:hypothetical protein
MGTPIIDHYGDLVVSKSADLDHQSRADVFQRITELERLAL